MRSTTTYRNRVARHLALGFAIAAVAAPIAQADVSIAAEFSGRQFGPTLAGAEIGQQPGTAQSYGELHQFPGAGLGETYGELHQFPGAGLIPATGAELDRREFGPAELPIVTIPEDLSGREFGPVTFTTDIPVTAPVANGFDWRDASVGAAIVGAVALLLAALALMVGRRRDLADA